MRILAFGEILWDIINGVEHLGGAPFNFAAHAAQCGHEAYIITRVGNDTLGKRAIDLSKKQGVSVTFIQTDTEHPTGTVDVTLSQGQPDYFIQENVAYDFISTEGKFHNEKSFDVFYFGSLAQRNDVSSKTLEQILSGNKFRYVFYDVNIRKGGYTEQIIKRSLKACNIFKLNADEVSVISEILVGSSLVMEEFCQCLKTLFPQLGTIIITASEKGCYIYQNELVHIAGNPVRVQDAVGAGDAFSASFMHVFAKTGDALLSAKTANQVGAFVATQTGAIPEYTPEIRQLLKV